MRVQVPLLVVTLMSVAACQDYPFETRPPKRVQAKKITEVVATIVPTDILFLVDNSGSMADQIAELTNNVDLFVNELAKSENDFQAAILTPDVECNVPRYVCTDTCPSHNDDRVGCTDPDQHPECGFQNARCEGIPAVCATLTDEAACLLNASCNWRGDCVLNWRLGSYSCCYPTQRPACADLVDVSGVVTSSDCDGGRLRPYERCSCPQHADKAACVADTANACTWQQLTRVFKRPEQTPEAQAEWAAQFKAAIAALGTGGSSYEGGLEAVRRAVSCSAQVGCDDPLDKAVRDLNAGFIRPEADLVVIFLSDEDDCSFADRNTYAQPLPASDPTQQSGHICGPNECYAYYACSVFTDQATCLAAAGCDWDSVRSVCAISTADCPQYSDITACNAVPGCYWKTATTTCEVELIEWADPAKTSAGEGLLQCGKSGSRVPRAANPPVPRTVDDFLDALAAAKGGDITRVRAAGIIGSVPSTTAPLASESAACVDSSSGPIRDCGCLAGTGQDPFLCTVTGAIGQRSSLWPSPADPLTGGCMAMPGGRYMELLRKLSQRRVDAFARSDTLVDSICRASYNETMYDIVNSIILNNCFDLGQTLGTPGDLLVTLNGQALAKVDEGSTDKGWSWRTCSRQICLEGGLRKAIGDEFELLALDDGCAYLMTKAACEGSQNCCAWVGEAGPCKKRN